MNLKNSLNPLNSATGFATTHCKIKDMQGMTYNLLNKEYQLTPSDLDVNYLIACKAD